MRVAFLGLGVMGFPMAGHLRARGGHDVAVYNRTRGKAQPLLDRFIHADLVVGSFTDGAEARQYPAAPEGVRAVLLPQSIYR